MNDLASFHRGFHWVSSRTAPTGTLHELQQKMYSYYSAPATRNHYQSMLGGLESTQLQVVDALTSDIARRNPSRVIELGCGSGWLLNHLMSKGLDPAAYTGAELSEAVIAGNVSRFPRSQWEHLKDYETSFEKWSFDVAYSFFVIEHCVYPERHLAELYRLIKPGGCLYVVCPDFVNSGIVPSQGLGRKLNRTKELLAKGDLRSALVAIYDSRVRLPRALKRMSQHLGPFVVNTNPRCLYDIHNYSPDVDAVYLASENDFRIWASEKNAILSFPAGRDHVFRTILFLQITKPSQADD